LSYKEDTMDDLLGAIIWLVESGGPSAVATNAVTFIARATRSYSAAAFAIGDGGDLRLFASHQIDQGVLDTVREAWVNGQNTLQAGEVARTEAGLISPLKSGADFVGLLFLGHSGTVELGSLARVLEILARAMRNASATSLRSEWASFLERTSPEEVAREQLVRLLEQNEWNVARVARLKRVSRPTIYNWMERYGIKRKRPLLQSV
jgi:hypothetical protein